MVDQTNNFFCQPSLLTRVQALLVHYELQKPTAEKRQQHKEKNKMRKIKYSNKLVLHS